MIREGDAAPDFTLPADDGSEVTLSKLRGERIVLYFYPRDDTPGCTTEACEFRDALPRFRERGARVFGISPDSVSSHVEFREKHDLTFRLLADEEHEVAEAYEVWKEKKMFGNTFWGVERSTFLVDQDGRVARVWRRVKPEGHAGEVAEALAG